MKLFETHAHVSDPQFDADREVVLQRAQEAGVECLVEIAESPDVWGKARALAEDGSLLRVFWACGFHPHYAEREASFDFDLMRAQGKSPDCVAVGEVGLDYFKSTASKESQISLFRKTLEVAADLQKPVIIHCRQAQADMLRILRSFFGGLSNSGFCAGVIHCFSGDQSFAEGCLDLGFYLGVDGPITYPSAKALREVLSRVPLEKIVLETDCPYLPPQAFRGKRNEPSYLKHVAEKLGEVLGKSPEEVSEAAARNARRLFRIRPHPPAEGKEALPEGEGGRP